MPNAISNPRAIAASLLCSVLSEHRSLTEVLAPLPQDENRPLIKALCYGTMRWFYYLDANAKTLMSKPLKEKDQDIYALILMGFFQLKFMRIKTHAAVNETVAAAKVLKKPWASKLINAL